MDTGKFLKTDMQQPDYWTKWYSGRWRMEPSPFAKWVQENFVIRPMRIVDCGCGDGRDSEYFSSKGNTVTGIDMADVDRSGTNALYVKADVMDSLLLIHDAELVYARWFLHAITKEQEIVFLDDACARSNMIALEFRVSEDWEVDDHYRRSVGLHEVRDRLLFNGWRVEFLDNGAGWSPRDGEDPFLGRVIAFQS